MRAKGDEAHSFVPQWGQEGYFFEGIQKIDVLSENDTPTIGREDPQAYFNQYGRPAGGSLVLPENIDYLLAKYYSLDNQARLAFLSSCALLDQGISLWSRHPSLSFAALVSAIETLISYEHRDKKLEKCKVCNQDRYRVTSKFRDFFMKYGSATPEFKKYAQTIYRYRCKVLHEGDLFLGEIKLRTFGSSEGFDDDDLRRSLIRNCRICLINWLTHQA
jgi:hypothetical protein